MDKHGWLIVEKFRNFSIDHRMFNFISSDFEVTKTDSEYF